MIVSASRRTDIPCWFAPWFAGRIRAGYVLTRNPMNHAQLSRIPLSPDVVDCIVFWTKDPQPMLPYLELLDRLGYLYYFQFTLTPYGRDLEPGLREKKDIMDTFRSLSCKIGSTRVLWRYDPIVINDVYNVTWHQTQFSQMCETLAPYTRRVTISFVDLYAKLRSNLFRALAGHEMEELAAFLGETARIYGLDICACCENMDLTPYGIRPAACIDRELIASICGCPLTIPRDANQRAGCGCAASIDIGAYDTCQNGCVYCYANHGVAALQRRFAQHDPSSELLYGTVREGEIIKLRQVHSYRNRQQTFFD